jgi:hypothetical protein
LSSKKNHNFFFKILKNIRTWIQTLNVRQTHALSRDSGLQTPDTGSAQPWAIGTGPHTWLQTQAGRSTSPRPKVCRRARVAYLGGGSDQRKRVAEPHAWGLQTRALGANPPVESLLTCDGVLQQVHVP